jgi:hypothetical protein
MQSAQVSLLDMKQEQHIEELYEEEIVKVEDGQEETYQEVYEEEGIDMMELAKSEKQLESESYIVESYEVEDEDGAEYIEEIEYLETEMPTPKYENIEYEEPKMYNSYPCEYCKPTIEFKTDLGLERHMFEEHQMGQSEYTNFTPLNFQFF